MKVNAYQCLFCGDIVYSRALHDFRECSCKKMFVDGGFDYIRVGYNTTFGVKLKVVKLRTTRKELFNDWNEGKDKYGLIRENDLGKKKGKIKNRSV